jgi:hypothetical protein
MIPTYNSANYLGRTLESVLSQDPGPDEMQIEVVDGGSTKDDPERVVNATAKDRVKFHRLPLNQGSSHTFNACIQRSCGQWIHILHGDDMVRPGFYDAYSALISTRPQVVMVLGGACRIDENDRVLGEFPRRDVDTAGVIPDFAERHAVRNLVPYFPAVVVRRSGYESAGGFCTWFTLVNDVDMWLRIGLLGEVGAVVQPYALWRLHSSSGTAKAVMSGDNIREKVLLALLNNRRGELPGAGERAASWKHEIAFEALLCAWTADRAGSTKGRLSQAAWAFKLAPGPSTFWFLAKSWLKHGLYELKHQQRRKAN